MKYLYAVISGTGTDLDLELVAFASPSGQFEIVTDGMLSAVVSDSSIASFAELPRGDLMRYLTLHQRAVETLMADTPLLPVKFGTLLPDAGQVRTVLYLGQGEFKRALETVGQRTEIDVAVMWEPAHVFAEIAQEPTVAAFKGQVASLPTEQTLQGRVAVGRLVKERFDARRNALRDALAAEITPCAARWRLNPVMDDSMVMNVACLVSGEEGEALEDRVYDLDERHKSQLQFRLVGPLPPYSFATVEARVVMPADVAQACTLLGLPANGSAGTFGSSTPEQVKYAYYAQARRYHPDLVGDNPAACAQFVRLTEAYRLMTEVAQRVPAYQMSLSSVEWKGTGTGYSAPYILVRVGGPEG